LSSALKAANLLRLVRFAVVGGSGVLVNVLVFQGMLFALRDVVEGTATAIPIANVAGIFVSIFTNFLLNDGWTWGDRVKGDRSHWWTRVARYYVSASLAAGVQLVVTSLSHAWVWASLLPDWNGVAVAPNVALLTGIACGMGINFYVAHKWAFKDAN
jgi:putative flippase GtrA